MNNWQRKTPSSGDGWMFDNTDGKRCFIACDAQGWISPDDLLPEICEGGVISNRVLVSLSGPAPLVSSDRLRGNALGDVSWVVHDNVAGWQPQPEPMATQ